MESAFYAADMTARGFCDQWSGCEAFSPSSATLKVGVSLRLSTAMLLLPVLG